MFYDSKYTKLYFKLISIYGGQNGEKHHIVPKSLGGTNDKDNLVSVPPRVHFILHRLLVKMCKSDLAIGKMRYALWRMMHPQSKAHNRRYSVSSKLYESLKAHQKQKLRENNPMKRPEVVEKFKKKRPEQSVVATKRNLDYWSTRKLPTLNLVCLVCKESFETNNPKRICCCKKCSATHNNRVRKLELQGASSEPRLN